MTRKIITTAVASAAMLAALGSSAVAGNMPNNFAAIDTNADGQVTYKEYAKSAKGMTQTAAAQQFIKISNGSQSFTEGDLMTAIAMQGDPNWGQTNAGTAYTQSTQPYTVSQPNTAVLSSTTQADIPRWSDGTPVDLDALEPQPSTSVTATTNDQYMSDTSGAYSAPSTTTSTVTTDGQVLGDITSTENPQMKVWDENKSGAHSATTTVTTTTDVDVNSGVESDTQDMMDAKKMKKEMMETVENPEMKIEVEPAPEK